METDLWEGGYVSARPTNRPVNRLPPAPLPEQLALPVTSPLVLPIDRADEDDQRDLKILQTYLREKSQGAVARKLGIDERTVRAALARWALLFDRAARGDFDGMAAGAAGIAALPPPKGGTNRADRA